MMRYWPLPSVTAERTFSMSAALAASTVTPGRIAPDVSFTTPVMDAWAYAVAGTITKIATTSNARVSLLIPTPLFRSCRSARFSFAEAAAIKHPSPGVVKRERRPHAPAGWYFRAGQVVACDRHALGHYIRQAVGDCDARRALSACPDSRPGAGPRKLRG